MVERRFWMERALREKIQEAQEAVVEEIKVVEWNRAIKAALKAAKDSPAYEVVDQIKSLLKPAKR